jgi:endonuclease G
MPDDPGMAKRSFGTRRRTGGIEPVVRRIGVCVVLAVAAAVQVPGCSLQPYRAPSHRPTVTTTLPPSSTQVRPQAAPQSPTTSAVAGDFSRCAQHFPGRAPAVDWPGRQRALCFDGFAVLYSGESKTAVYTVERLTRSSVDAAKFIKRTDRFYPEARLPSVDRAQLADYVGSGYDRGHMAPAGDMPTDAAKAQSFSLANMVPQAPELNQRAWSQIEQATRKYAARASGDVFVFTGPAFEQRPRTIGAGKVWVPSHTWKVVYSRGDGRTWAYWATNDAGRHDLQPISYQDFRQRSGLDLLAQTSS